jgi:hypothetical protein
MTMTSICSTNVIFVIMDTKMTFVEHIDVIVGRAFATLGFVRRLASEFKDEYTLRTLYTSLVRPKLEHASCVWHPTYIVHREKIESVQKKFERYALRIYLGLGLTVTIYHLMKKDAN